jgi:hypothetical protein
MPRDILILTARKPTLEALKEVCAEAANLVTRTGARGTAVSVHTADAAAHLALAFGSSQLVGNPCEVARLAPSAPDVAGPVWWTEGWAPWGATGDAGVALALADQLDGICIVQGA